MTDVVDLAALPDPTLAALIFAVDPFGFGGIALRARAGLARDRWLEQLRDLLPGEAPWRRVPSGTAESRLFGGLDLTATLASGRPVAERGILAEAHGGVVLLGMAERMDRAIAARLGLVLDGGHVVVARDGLDQASPARVGMVALDEGIEDERMPVALLERMAFWLDLDPVDLGPPAPAGRRLVSDARNRLVDGVAPDACLSVLAETAMALGVGSMRATLLALRAAQTSAALQGRTAVTADDAALAARLVLAPRATRLPVDSNPGQEQAGEPPPEATPQQDQPSSRDAAEGETRGDDTLGDLVLAAAKAAIPPDLLQRLQALAAGGSMRSSAGRAGAIQSSTKRGRPAGVRRGVPIGAARLNVIETLRAAAPWQPLRRLEGAAVPERIQIRRDDLRVKRFKQKTETTTIFVVDASGSLAVNRLAEAKGAVELLLAECYIRRDQVALLAFRGSGADLLLPPTRSLTRAKRCLSALPGGGPTPLACAIDAAVLLADQLRRRGQTPVVVFLTDGRANVARNGTTGRGLAEEDALVSARRAAASGMRMLVVDASPRPHAQARALASAMKAVYLPLPRAEAASLSTAVRLAGRG